MEAQAAGLQAFAERALGVSTWVDLACLPARSTEDPGEYQIGRVIDRRVGDGASILFVLPAAFDLNIWQRTMLGEELGAARRRHAGVSIHHDSVDPTHALLVDCFAGQILRALDERGVAPRNAGLVLVADGQGEPATRADSYRLMRLLWEQAGLGRGEVGFVRHPQPFLPETLERCLSEPLDWLLLPQCQWDGELCDFARVMLDDHQRAHPEAAGWRLLDPPRDHPAILAWLEQRMLRLWQEKRARQAARIPSARNEPPPAQAGVWSGADWVPAGEAQIRPRAGCVARARDSAALAEILARVLPQAERYLVKVTWHGYAPGTYTGPLALDLLLGALPGRAVLLEGHTSSRNVGGAEIDWEADAERHRTWVRQQDVEFLRRTGLAEVIARHGAQYLNVTEAWWDGACAPAEDVRAVARGRRAPESGAGRFRALGLDGASRDSVDQLRPLQGADPTRPLEPLRLDPAPVANRVARAGHHPLRVGLLRPGPALRVLLSPVRFRGGLRLGRALGSQGAVPQPLGELRPRPHRRAIHR